MRRLAGLGLLTISLISCRRSERIPLEPTDESVPKLSSAISVADPTAAIQLLKGFHELEQNSWRWTMGRFAVLLKPPDVSKEKGAVLRFRFTIPEPVLKRLGVMTLRARIGSAQFSPARISEPGEHLYERPVPASALQSDLVTIDFKLDEFVAAGDIDTRELGLIAAGVALESR